MSDNNALLSELGMRFGLPLGWEQGDRDPWLNWRSFDQWLKDSWKPESELEIFLITASSRGSTHLAYWCCHTCSQLNFSQYSPAGLLYLVDLAAISDASLRLLGVPANGTNGELIDYNERLHPMHIRKYELDDDRFTHKVLP